MIMFGKLSQFRLYRVKERRLLKRGAQARAGRFLGRQRRGRGCRGQARRAAETPDRKRVDGNFRNDPSRKRVDHGSGEEGLGPDGVCGGGPEPWRPGPQGRPGGAWRGLRCAAFLTPFCSERLARARWSLAIVCASWVVAPATLQVYFQTLDPTVTLPGYSDRYMSCNGARWRSSTAQDKGTVNSVRYYIEPGRQTATCELRSKTVEQEMSRLRRTWSVNPKSATQTPKGKSGTKVLGNSRGNVHGYRRFHGMPSNRVLWEVGVGELGFDSFRKPGASLCCDPPSRSAGFGARE